VLLAASCSIRKPGGAAGRERHRHGEGPRLCREVMGTQERRLADAGACQHCRCHPGEVLDLKGPV